ncbi:MAG TPA: hypothetical protein VGM33_06235 [Baekduia sp.]
MSSGARWQRPAIIGTATASVVLAAWRGAVALQTDSDGYGEAARKHEGLLLLQAVCALLMAFAIVAAGDAVTGGSSRRRLHALTLFTLALAAFALIFTKHGLLDFDAYEN